jgi:hypothetical protein
MKGGQKEDSHAEFRGAFRLEGAKTVQLRIAVDSDYAFYLNGELVSFGAFADYPNHPVADEVSFAARAGDNEFRIATYYCGASCFSCYCPGIPRLIFELSSGDEILAYSGCQTLSRISPCYEIGLKRKITPQLGYSFSYDATKEKDESGWAESELRPEQAVYRRDNQKCVLLERAPSIVTRLGSGHYLVDLQRETVGLLNLSFVSPRVQRLMVAYGEHLVAGHVPYRIQNRDFHFDFVVREGKNEILHPFRRLGARYLEFFFEEDVKVGFLTLRPTEYPFGIRKYRIGDGLRQKIYDVSQRTLVCCYHDHYEDCPWREQCLYILDSANQMRCGYLCFTNRETMVSSLALLLRNERSDGLIAICSPTCLDFVIPSFNLHLFSAVEDYLDATGDAAFVREHYQRIQRVIDAFVKRVEEGRLVNFEGPSYWNFYDWKEGLDYPAPGHDDDLIASCLFLLALRSFGRISQKIGKEERYTSLADHLAPLFRKRFFVEEECLFSMYAGERKFNKLGQALAILAGLANKIEARHIASILKTDSLQPEIALSNRRFFYDALLQVDPANKDFILADIEMRYKKMLDDGATTFYETEDGWKDFDGAGSLCHGWSALPIYYYHLFGLGRYEE